MKGITDHAQHAKLMESGLTRSQPVAHPTGDVVSQLAQQQQHFLGMKRLFVALGDAQPLFGAFDGGFYAAAPQVIGVNSQPDSAKRWGKRAFALLVEPAELLIIASEDQDSGPLCVNNR